MRLSRLPVFLALVAFAVIIAETSARASNGNVLPDNVVKSDKIDLKAHTATVITSVNPAKLQELLQKHLDDLGPIGHSNTPPQGAQVVPPPGTSARKRRTIPEGAKLYKLEAKYTITYLDEL